MSKPLDRSDDDICYCGDRRDDHVGGTGMCRLNGLGHGMGAPTNGECHKFRFARKSNGVTSIDDAEFGMKP